MRGGKLPDKVIDEVVNNAPIQRRQLLVTLFQRLASCLSFSDAIEGMKELRVQLVGKESFRKFTKIKLQNTGSGVNIDFFQQLLSFVRIWNVKIRSKKVVQWSLCYTSLRCKSPLFVRPIGTVSSRILYMALYGGLFSLIRPSQFYVQFFESRLGRITERPQYKVLLQVSHYSH